jgi:two-component system, LytTR family, response regulator
MFEVEHDKIAIPVVGGFEFYRTNTIIRLEGDSNSTKFMLTNKKVVGSSYGLKVYESQLIGKGFMRVHQSHIINLDYVKGYRKGDGGIVVMEDGSEVDVSRSHKDMLMRELVKLWGCASIIDKVLNHSG